MCHSGIERMAKSRYFKMQLGISCSVSGQGQGDGVICIVKFITAVCRLLAWKNSCQSSWVNLWPLLSVILMWLIGCCLRNGFGVLKLSLCCSQLVLFLASEGLRFNFLTSPCVLQYRYMEWHNSKRRLGIDLHLLTAWTNTFWTTIGHSSGEDTVVRMNLNLLNNLG